MVSELNSSDVKNQYALLSILDGKAAALLTFNAIFLATLAIWIQNLVLNAMHLILDLVFIALLLSCYLILRVIPLKWSSGAETASELNDLRAHRTESYQRAWQVSKWSILAVIAVTAVHTLGTVLHVADACDGRCAWFYGPSVFGGFG